MSARATWPAPTRVTVALIGGTLLGGMLVGPAVPGLLMALPSIGSLGPIGAVLIAGSLALLGFAMGLFVLYFGFLMIENRM
jgi:hypothetical protein